MTLRFWPSRKIAPDTKIDSQKSNSGGNWGPILLTVVIIAVITFVTFTTNR